MARILGRVLEKGMRYDLALELKNAGFPQRQMGGNHVLPSGEILPYIQANTAYIPTLEELIEECGEDFYSLRTADGKKWVAHPKKMLEALAVFATSPNKSWSWNAAIGDSSAEAVAKLWLALKKHRE